MTPPRSRTSPRLPAGYRAKPVPATNRRLRSLMRGLLGSRRPTGKATTRGRTATARQAPAAPTQYPAAATRSPKRTRAPRGKWLAATYHGRAGSRPYFVYVPSGLRRRTPVPLLVLLHGCGQSAADFAAATRFNELADRHGFLVVYPQQPAGRHRHRCWRWYESAHQGRDAGEPAIIAGITTAVTTETQRWRIDPQRIYVAGLSAGGAMALVLSAAYPDLYAAVGVHSAPPYRSASTGTNALAAMAGYTVVSPPRADGSAPALPPAILIHGTADNTVRASNGARIAHQWQQFHGVRTSAPDHPDRITRSKVTTHRRTDGRACTTTRWYTARGRKVLEYWQVDGLGHAWSGGRPNGSYSDPRGPRASTAMWNFFASKRLDPAAL